jgi:hypothetical protein
VDNIAYIDMNSLKYDGCLTFLVITKASETSVEVHVGMSEKEFVFTKQDAVNELAFTHREAIVGP